MRLGAAWIEMPLGQEDVSAAKLEIMLHSNSASVIKNACDNLLNR